MLEEDMKWFVSTCHPVRLSSSITFIFPQSSRDSIPFLQGSYQHYAHADCKQVLLPCAGLLCLVILAQMALTLEGEQEDPWGFNIQGDPLQMGGVTETMMDNGLEFVAAAAYLSEKYGIHHIKISPYNSQVNGLVEHKHFDVHESLMKACDNNHSKWVRMAPSIFWPTMSLSTG